ncbi:MAG: tetratricopeptide repeat protein [Spirochaetia bacterium]
MRTNRKIIVLIIALAVAGHGLSSQDASTLAPQPERTNYLQRYNYPLGIGIGYRYGLDSSVGGDLRGVMFIDASVRRPLQFLPMIQPLARFGVMLNNVEDDPATGAAEDVTRANTAFFVGAGSAFTFRPLKLLEFGVDATVGYMHRVLTNQGQFIPELVISAGGAATIVPFFNFSLELRAAVDYVIPLVADEFYAGLYPSFGAVLSLRLGEDPDAGGQILRSIRFGEPQVQPLFAAMHSYHAVNPVGSIDLTNVEDSEIVDIEVSLWVPEFMNTPTPSATISVMAPGETRTVEFPASFNNTIFNFTGSQPVNGELVVSYRLDDKTGEQRRSVIFKMYDKTSLTWDDDRKVAAFMTSDDPNVVRYSSEIRGATREAEIDFLSRSLQQAMQIYYGMAELGMIYQSDPVKPFTQMQEETVAVDNVSLPRDMLVRATGDCDDLTVLYNSILESAGVQTAFVTTPGHIYSAVNTGVSAREYERVHPDRDMTLVYNDQLWALIEITLVGRDDLLDAWRTGIREYKQYDSEPAKRGFYVTREAKSLYEPIVLQDERIDLDYGDLAVVRYAFEEDLAILGDILLERYRSQAESRGRDRDYNRLGIMAAQLARYTEAEGAFNSAIEKNADYTAARINLGSMYFLLEEYDRALEVFDAALQSLESTPRRRAEDQLKVLLNLSKTSYELREFDASASYFEMAAAIDSEAVAEFTHLAAAGGGSDAGRAAESETWGILFVEGE